MRMSKKTVAIWIAMGLLLTGMLGLQLGSRCGPNTREEALTQLVEEAGDDYGIYEHMRGKAAADGAADDEAYWYAKREEALARFLVYNADLEGRSWDGSEAYSHFRLAAAYRQALSED